MQVVEYMERHGHEQLSIYTDPSAGLRAFIAIHDTALGPALGGVRVWPHPTEDEAVMDVLRLSRAMTYKSASAGLPFGGGKGLIIANPRKDKTEAMMRGLRQVRREPGWPIHHHRGCGHDPARPGVDRTGDVACNGPAGFYGRQR